MGEIIRIDFKNRQVTEVDFSSTSSVRSDESTGEKTRRLKTPDDTPIGELIEQAIETLVDKHSAERGGDELEITDKSLTAQEAMSMLDETNRAVAKVLADAKINRPSPEAS